MSEPDTQDAAPCGRCGRKEAAHREGPGCRDYDPDWTDEDEDQEVEDEGAEPW